MKITAVEVYIMKEPVAKPVADAMWKYDAGGTVITKVLTDEGISGFATTNFGRVFNGPDVQKTLTDKVLSPSIIGMDPFDARLIRKQLWDSAHYFDVTGITQFAIAAIDICVWDIMGKGAGKPVSKLLGGYRDRIPAYAMVGWYYEDEATYVRRCVEAVEEGFKALKVKVGISTLEYDIQRIKVIQKELPGIRLMVDANQIFDEVEALRRGRVYQDMGIYWFEEPLAPQFIQSYARLCAALDMPVASGENWYTRYQFYENIRQGAADIVQPDNRRAGGVLEWLEIAAISEAAGLKLASHGGGPSNVNLLCSIPNAIYLETGSLKSENRLYRHKMVLEDGALLLPNTPGMGTDIDEEYMKKHAVV